MCGNDVCDHSQCLRPCPHGDIDWSLEDESLLDSSDSLKETRAALLALRAGVDRQGYADAAAGFLPGVFFAGDLF